MWTKTGKNEQGFMATGPGAAAAPFVLASLRSAPREWGAPPTRHPSLVKVFFISCLCLLFSSFVYADVAIETSVSRSRLSVGEDLTLDIIITNDQLR
jgi:hypothetical protein